MTIPGCGLKAEVPFRREVAPEGANEANKQEDCADNNVSAMEARRHEKRRTVNMARVAEGGVKVLIGLEAREDETKNNSQDEAEHEAATVILQKRIMRPRHRDT